jgi:DNA-directed RNA polymerase sigma subunit (sigma70/sigma32)
MQPHEQRETSVVSVSSRKRKHTGNVSRTMPSTQTSQYGYLRLGAFICCTILSLTTLVEAFFIPTSLLHTTSRANAASIMYSSQLSTISDTLTNANRNGKLEQSIDKKLSTTSFDLSRTAKAVQRLSVQEQQALFRHVLEVRRIRKVEQELQQEYESNVAHVEPVMFDAERFTNDAFMLELAQRTGYGNNVKDLETALILGQQAREELITTNMGLVHYCVRDIVKHRTLRSVTNDDLIQEGAIGLSRAVDKYNPSYNTASTGSDKRIGKDSSQSSSITMLAKSSPSFTTTAKFSTYAVYWIRAAVLRTISERDDIMRVPEHVTTAIRKISNVVTTFGLQMDQDENESYPFDSSTTAKTLHVEESETVSSSSSSSVYWLNNEQQDQDTTRKIIADQTGFSDQMVQNAMMVRNRRNKYSSTVLSYESWMQLGKHYETDNVMQYTSSFDKGIGETNTEHMKEILSGFLRPKEMEALSWRYGLNVDGMESLNPLAKRDYVADAELELFGTSTPIKHKPLSTKTDIVQGKWGEAMSFTEVGKQMKVSAEYGRRLCHAAIQKLRRAVDDGRLEPALLL